MGFGSKDLTGNTSGQSNTESFTTTLNGVMFNLHAGGTWDQVKDFSFWSPLASGTYHNFDLSAINGLYQDGNPDPNYFAFEFFGYLNIQQEGLYTFSTISDDGSQLWIGDEEIVDNDFLHGPVKVTEDSVFLTSGIHPITVKYFERTGGQTLSVFYSGPDTGDNEIEIPDAALTSAGGTTSSATRIASKAAESSIDTDLGFVEELRIFPNPTESNNINLKGYIETESSAVSVQLINMIGKVQFESSINTDQILNGVELRTSQALKAGIYIIQITDEQSVISRNRLVIK